MSRPKGSKNKPKDTRTFEQILQDTDSKSQKKAIVYKHHKEHEKLAEALEHTKHLSFFEKLRWILGW